MMADFEFRLMMKGNCEQLTRMLQIIGPYFEEGKKPAYFTDAHTKGKDIDFDNIQKEIISSGEITITAYGPYGEFFELNDVDIFRDLADAVPDAYFNGEISGEGEYETQDLKCELKEKVLNIETSILSNEDEDDEVDNAWIDDFVKRLPLNKFVDVFKVVGDDFDNDSYRNVVGQIAYDYSDLSEMELGDFTGYLNECDAETELNEDEFIDAVNEKLSNVGIMSLEYFRDDYECSATQTKKFVYDPVKKKTKKK